MFYVLGWLSWEF